MKKLLWVLSLGVFLLLAGCSAETDSQAATETESGGLTTNYNNALSFQAQLALGTVQLEETELAVSQEQAKTLLPLWQAFQSLSNSDTTAEVELQAVVNQIQEGMTKEQVAAIAGMSLTTDSMTELMESGAVAFGRRGGQQAGDSTTTGQQPPAGFAPPAGGFPGGGVPGGGIPGGGFPGGVAGGGTLSEDDIATRRAEFESGDAGNFQDRALIFSVIRLLQEKVGLTVDPNVIFTAIAELLNITTDELRTEMMEGKTLTQVVEAHSKTVEEAQVAITDALNALPNAGNLNVQQIANNWLTVEQP